MLKLWNWSPWAPFANRPYTMVTAMRWDQRQQWGCLHETMMAFSLSAEKRKDPTNINGPVELFRGITPYIINTRNLKSSASLSKFWDSFHFEA